MKPEDLITYCGVYGGACARWKGYKAFRNMVSALAEWLKQQIKKANQGFEVHTDKYYQSCIKKLQ